MDPNSHSHNNPLYDLPPKKKVVLPLPGQNGRNQLNPAVELIRSKISNLYTKEPDAKQELAEAEAPQVHHSEHQKFMQELSASGKSLAEIQTAWHKYYVELPDKEKHEVWQEFYEQHGGGHSLQQKPTAQHTTASRTAKPVHKNPPRPKPEDSRTISDIKNQLVDKIQTRPGTTSKSAHLRSLLFGLSMGGVVVLFLLFGFFNERIIAPFITPSKAVSNTPIIIDPTGTAVTAEPKVIIPKINVEIPVIYTEPSIKEAAVQHALEDGVVHYATTPNPGETGNGVIFGHSSNNILNKGKYKFAFVLLNRMEAGDTFMLQKDGKRYVYRVYSKKIVKPNDVSVLGAAEKPSSFTLITCDPPGTSLNRLIVVGEQISPDPGANVASSASQTATAVSPEILPANAPSLWQRFTDWLTG